MKLYVTVGTTEGYIEKEFDVPEGEWATYLGLEIDAKGEDREPQEGKRQMIVRIPFVHHVTAIHTMCNNGDDETLQQIEGM